MKEKWHTTFIARPSLFFPIALLQYTHFASSSSLILGGKIENVDDCTPPPPTPVSPGTIVSDKAVFFVTVPAVINDVMSPDQFRFWSGARARAAIAREPRIPREKDRKLGFYGSRGFWLVGKWD